MFLFLINNKTHWRGMQCPLSLGFSKCPFDNNSNKATGLWWHLYAFRAENIQTETWNEETFIY